MNRLVGIWQRAILWLRPDPSTTLRVTWWLRQHAVRRNGRVFAVTVLFVLAFGLLAQTQGSMMASAANNPKQVDPIIAKLRSSIAGVNDYSARGVMSITSPTLHVSGSRFRLYYQKPDRMHIEPEGSFAIVPRGTYMGNPVEELIRDNTFKLTREERFRGRQCWVVQVTPKVDSPGSIEATLWIDKARGLILASRAEPEPDAKINVDWDYIQVDDKFWLPSKIVITIDGLPAHIARQRGPFVKTSGKAEGKAVIEFSNYRVNKGIPESVFRRK